MGIYIHAAIQLEQDVLRRSIDHGAEGQVRAGGEARHFDLIGERFRCDPFRIASIGKEIRIEIGVAIRAIATGVSHGSGSQAILVDIERRPSDIIPTARSFRRAPGKGKIATGRDDDFA